MRILVDTNILIPLEPTAPEHAEAGTAMVAELVRLAQGTHQILVHPTSLGELGRDTDEARRELRGVLLRKYVELNHPPAVPREIEAELGRPSSGSHDVVDHLLLSAVHRDAVDLLVTEDDRIHRKARRIGIPDRVVRVRDAIELLGSLLGRVPTPPPFVSQIPAHALNEADAIFESFRQDYPGFDEWLRRVKREGRPAWVIEESGGAYAGVCLLKEGEDEYHLGGRVVKISSFKVSERQQGNRYGELLLKTVFRFCDENRYDATWVTVFEKHAALITLLTDFGFWQLEERTGLAEGVFAKRFRYGDAERDTLHPLDLHIRFGPPALKLVAGDVFLVPIIPTYHKLLFPDAEAQLEMVPRAFGNALRKAYLSRGSIRRLQPGSCLLFYRSQDLRAVTCAGVVESTLVSRDADAVARFVGQRTVYSYEEIDRMCASEVLAILFRQDRLLKSPIDLDELVANRAAMGAPQSIMTVPTEAVPWLTQRIDV